MNRLERHTRSPDQLGNTRRRSQPQHPGNHNNKQPTNGRRREFSQRQRSRSWSRSRSRDRSHDRRRQYSRSRSRDRGGQVYKRGGRDSSSEMYPTHMDEEHSHDRYDRRGRDSDRRGGNSRRDRYGRRDRSSDSFQDDTHSNDSYDSDQLNNSEHYTNQTPSYKIIILGLSPNVTETDINNDLIHYGLQSVSIRLIRKRKTGTSRGFAFVEFNTQEEATRWMEFKQGVLTMGDNNRATMQYSVVHVRDKITTDWYCAKCGVLNFKRRDSCFKCHASRKESEKGGEGSDEISNILTKKILLRNLDVLTNEEGVLTLMQEVVPELVGKISKILICRDPLTSTSRGICYLTFDNLVDSMNTFNALKAIDPALTIGNREVIVTYCVDSVPADSAAPYYDQHRRGPSEGGSSKGHHGHKASFGNHHHHQQQPRERHQSKEHYYSGASSSSIHDHQSNTHQYTLSDVPRLAEYSANVYASNVAEHDHYYKYYTEYYINEINQGHFAGLPTINQIGDTANSGAAVALSAIQRQQKLQQRDFSVATNSHARGVAQPAALTLPTGRDNKKYDPPDTSQYQYDDKSGFFLDPICGLYYDPNSQYYYNSESCEYMYWNAELSTYILAEQTASSENAAQSATAGAKQSSNATACDTSHDNLRKDGNNKSKPTAPPPDKVKVAKKIVKDMEKWAKQLNQKKDMFNYPQLATPVEEPAVPPSVVSAAGASKNVAARSSGYADIGFSILENKERGGQLATSAKHVHMASGSRGATSSHQVLAFESDSDNEHTAAKVLATAAAENSYVAFDKLTCMLCKRAFPSADVMQKHLRMSQLHKENLAKFNQSRNGTAGGESAASAAAAAAAEAAAYRDRAKERRQKYGESDPPPVNKTRERWTKEMVKQSAAIQQSQESKTVAAMPIGESNVGNRLLQKMGWSEGQGLGRKNQGRTNIIEAESRAPTAGLGTKSIAYVPGDDYMTYVKRMMQARYEREE